jgi:hypothetical protein
LWLAGARSFSFRIEGFCTLKSLCPCDWFDLLRFLFFLSISNKYE